MLHPEKCARTYPGAKKPPTKPVRSQIFDWDISQDAKILDRWEIHWIIRFSSEFYCWWCISTIRWVGKACYLKWRANAEKEIAKVIPEKSSLLSKCQSSRSRERAVWPSWRAPMTRPRTRRARPGTTPTSRQRQRCTPTFRCKDKDHEALKQRCNCTSNTLEANTKELHKFLDKDENKGPRQGFVRKKP